MTQAPGVTEWFDTHQGQLRGLAYRMLGSLSDAEDALQDTWLRASAADTKSIEKPGAWLKTVLARVCLNMVRSRGSHREEPLGTHLPDPIVTAIGTGDPEEEALLAESVGLALLVVIQTLSPAERLAFLLHDVFDLTFDEIAPIIDRSPAAARQLASRARRRVQAAPAVPDADLVEQRRVVDAFFAAARGGDLETLVAVLDPDVVLRGDLGPSTASRVVRGLSETLRYARPPSGAVVVVPAVVNGTAGAVILRNQRLFSVMAFTVRSGRIVEIDALGDPERLRRLDLGAVLGPSHPELEFEDG
ncbi:MAG TPA: sigma-70 family RNA polymerase sigma factor [Candidatus Binatia bacterium]|nr:sigma-70 family RNA polymerase sigma factor [Candidatus Binatia bacterium]